MKILFQILAICLIAATLCICAIKPEMHKTVLVYNSDYKLVSEEDVKTETQEIAVMEMPAAPKVETVKMAVETVSTPKTTRVEQTTVQTPKTTTNVSNKTNVKQNTLPKSNSVKVTTTTTTQPVQKNEVQVKKSETKTIKTRPPIQIQQKTLTQKEEEIAWNVWRSNLQNQIMHDVKLPALPNGIVFRFSFNVDKYGKISNIYTYSDNPAYTPYAIQYIAPVIRSYQGKSILDFPQGSTRITTEFKGGWKISSSERLSTPQDYNDYEKVKKVN